ncbi:hypothetical protein POM88_054923 [Heracleum sosnowskyi]|uniref:Uncharacterized protein n=1 Tax=Heracleum sosnowskyi TaxID=360622 RepID=A0AAD8GM15_9APIA|nr:hypothetical protein POM88_054923 [Heracleum sosnowskyi]
MPERGDEEIESKRKRNDSVPCLDIIPFSENNNYPWVNTTITKKRKKTHLDTEPMDSAMWMDKIMNSYRSEDHKRAIKLYRKDVNESDGFDVRNKPPQMGNGGHKIFRVYDPPNIVPKFYTLNALRCLSNLAISVYNQNKGKNYDNVQVMMAMGYGCRDEYYNITFKASVPSENTVTFQTKACLILHRPYQIAEIKFVREFNSEDHEDESVVFGEDSKKLPLYLSEFALEEYNLHQLSCSGFTMEQNAMYGGVKVLRCGRLHATVCKLENDAASRIEDCRHNSKPATEIDSLEPCLLISVFELAY